MNTPKVRERPKLESCPFCGGAAIQENDTGPRDESYWQWIECVECGAKADDEFSWNRRTPDAAREARVAHLHELLQQEMVFHKDTKRELESRVAELEKALEAMLDDYRTDGCPWPECGTCQKSKRAYNKARAALANTQESQT